MTHFSSAYWIDLVRGSLTGEVAVAIEQHLALGCVTCVEAHRFWQRVTPLIAERAPANGPDVDARKEEQSPVTAMLVFDTFQQALPVGIRSGALGSRHLLYRVDDLTADLRLEASARTERILLIGQIADARHCNGGLGHVRLSLASRTRELASLDANELGEFQCEFERQDGLMLSLNVPHRPTILIPIDRLPVPCMPTGTTTRSPCVVPR